MHIRNRIVLGAALTAGLLAQVPALACGPLGTPKAETVISVADPSFPGTKAYLFLRKEEKMYPPESPEEARLQELLGNPIVHADGSTRIRISLYVEGSLKLSSHSPGAVGITAGDHSEVRGLRSEYRCLGSPLIIDEPVEIQAPDSALETTSVAITLLDGVDSKPEGKPSVELEASDLLKLEPVRESRLIGREN